MLENLHKHLFNLHIFAGYVFQFLLFVNNEIEIEIKFNYVVKEIRDILMGFGIGCRGKHYVQF